MTRSRTAREARRSHHVDPVADFSGEGDRWGRQSYTTCSKAYRTVTTMTKRISTTPTTTTSTPGGAAVASE